MEADTKWSWWKPIEGKVKIVDSYVFIDGGLTDEYYPFDFKNLPNVLAKVTNQNEIIDFVEKYGLLGRQKFFPYKHAEHEDPDSMFYPLSREHIEWFLSHAKTVRFVLSLINILQKDDDSKILDLLQSFATTAALNNYIETAPKHMEMYTHLFAEKAEIMFTPYFPMMYKDNVKELALMMINHLININTQGVYRKIITVNNEPKPFIAATNLIEAIWYIVGDAYILSFSDKGKAIRTCEECGLPFIVTDLRQRFCPGDTYSNNISLCGSRNRVRKYDRQKSKKAESI